MSAATQLPRLLLILLLLNSGADAADPPSSTDQPQEHGTPHTTLHVTHDGEGEFSGHTGEPIREALDQLRDTGGTVLLEPGEYLVRRKLVLSDNITLRGSAEATATVLRLPAPTLTTAGVSQGDRIVPVADATIFASGTTVQILPPKGTDRFDELEDETKSATIEAVEVTSIDGVEITLADPLPVDLPKGSRIGYAHNLLSMRKPTRDVTIENLTLEGGRTSDLPMPGHAKRCAIWASSPYSYAEGPKAPPVRGLRVQHCIIRDFYGRAVAMYNVAESEVIGCRIARIPDDAINFDHFNENNRAVGNTVVDAHIGVTLNDAAHCTVRYNRLVRCSSGVRVWWWHLVDPAGVNVHNTIEHNTILAPEGDAIFLGKHAVENTVRHNFVEGPVVEVEEKKNTIANNTRLDAGDDGSLGP